MPAFSGSQNFTTLRDVAVSSLKSGDFMQWTGTKWINVDVNMMGQNYELIADRTYEAIVRVGPTRTYTTISAAVSAITDATAEKRYLIAIEPGTYNEEVLLNTDNGKYFIDLIGQDRDTTIIQSTSQVYDTVNLSGGNATISNLTIRHTSMLGETYKYPIHADAGTPAALPSSVVTVYNCTVEALGTNAKSGIGVGLHGNQRVYLINSSFFSNKLPALYFHNWAGESAPAYVAVINCTAVSSGDTSNGAGLWLANLGSGQDDKFIVKGGSLSGPNSYDVKTENQAPGNGEWYLELGDNVRYTTTSMVSGQRRLYGTVVPKIPNIQSQLNNITGALRTGTLGMNIGSDAVMNTYRADRAFYFANPTYGNMFSMTDNATNIWFGNTGASRTMNIRFDSTFKTQLTGTNGSLTATVSGLTALSIDNTAKLTVSRTLAHAGSSLGFYNTAPITKPTVTGAKGSNAALASLITALVNLGLITDTTSA